MMTCPVCGQELMEGALLCSNCGTFLRTGGQLSTDPLGSEQGDQASSELAPPVFDTAPSGSTLVLKGLTDPREIAIPRQLSNVLLGRGDRLAGLHVDFDLTAEGGQTFGVSRRHARIRFVNERYLIEDLESLNGTYLNHRKLVPFVPEVIHDGDEVRFGSLTFTIVLKGPAPAKGG
jgi:pSer/pThr/pTyr-binding forkhead associated (FHA) protein